MMDSLDEGVGLVLDELERTGQARRTLVFYLSDNGGPTHQSASRNDPFSGRKGGVHEGGIRVPFIAAWPGTIPAGQVLSDPVISLDILPTALAAAGHDALEAFFRTPRDACSPQTLYHWMNGNASKAGITKDLEAMRAAGMGGVLLFDTTCRIPDVDRPHAAGRHARLAASIGRLDDIAPRPHLDRRGQQPGGKHGPGA